MKLFPRPRLLPVVIVAAALLLSMKVGQLWREGGEAIAATATPDTVKSDAPKPEAAPNPPATPVKADMAPASKDAKDTAADDDEAANAAGADCSAQEMATIQQATKQRAELDKRSGALDQKELLLKALESQVNDKIQTLHQKQAELDQLLGKVDEQNEERLKSLVKIYETMKPTDSARILDQMDMPVLIQLMSRMKEAKTAPILAAMSPGRAKTITIEMASKQSLPADLKTPSAVN